MEIENRILFVEGDDDLHTISALCGQLDVEETFAIVVPNNQGKIDRNAPPHKRGGIDNVFKAARVNLIASSNIERLGIVIDADVRFSDYWNEVKQILKRVGYDDALVPEIPDTTGTVIIQPGLPTFGVWVMPDNQSNGILEDFLQFSIPDAETNPVWNKAVESSEEVLNIPEQTFPAHHLSKAKLHTFLAWQKESGIPFGRAISRKFLRIDEPRYVIFVNWLNRLFAQ